MLGVLYRVAKRACSTIAGRTPPFGCGANVAHVADARRGRPLYSAGGASLEARAGIHVQEDAQGSGGYLPAQGAEQTQLPKPSRKEA